MSRRRARFWTGFWAAARHRCPAAPTIPCAAVFGSRFMRALYHAGGLRFREERVVHNGVRLSGAAASLLRATVRSWSGRASCGSCSPAASPRSRACTPRLRLWRCSTPTGLAWRGFASPSSATRNDAAYLARLRGIIDRLGLASSVDLRPAVPEESLFALFQDHDVYLFPSLYEPFSLTLIHALAAGIPTVASRIGGNIEIVHERETGLLFAKSDAADLARAVAELAADPALARPGVRWRARGGGRLHLRPHGRRHGTVPRGGGVSANAAASP